MFRVVLLSVVVTIKLRNKHVLTRVMIIPQKCAIYGQHSQKCLEQVLITRIKQTFSHAVHVKTLELIVRIKHLFLIFNMTCLCCCVGT